MRETRKEAKNLYPQTPGKQIPKRILLADDKKAIRGLVSRFLEFIGYEVALAIDGIEALAVNQAMNFYNLPDRTKAKQIKRVMTESAAQFTHAATARQYIELYEKMLKRPLII
jgi:CheY-like chemotaxis protein